MMCDHVYVSTKEIICSKCNKPTHEIDWDKEFYLCHIEQSMGSYTKIIHGGLSRHYDRV